MTFEDLTCILGPLKTLVCCGRFHADLVAIARYHTNLAEKWAFLFGGFAVKFDWLSHSRPNSFEIEKDFE